jgi:hypothetical protein
MGSIRIFILQIFWNLNSIGIQIDLHVNRFLNILFFLKFHNYFIILILYLRKWFLIDASLSPICCQKIFVILLSHFRNILIFERNYFLLRIINIFQMLFYGKHINTSFIFILCGGSLLLGV